MFSLKRRKHSRMQGSLMLGLGVVLLCISVTQVTLAQVVNTQPGEFTELVGIYDSPYIYPFAITATISGSSPDPQETLLIDSTNPDIMLVPTYGSGVWKSIDGGRTWMPKNNGLLNLNIDVVRADPNIAGRFYACQSPFSGPGSGFIYRSDDWAETWKKVAFTSQPLPVNMWVTDLAIDENGTLWVTVTGSTNECGALFRSDDAGMSWCSYYGADCETEIHANPCPSGVGQLPIDDGAGVDPLDLGPPSVDEVYYHDAKIQWPSRGSHRSLSDKDSIQWRLHDVFFNGNDCVSSAAECLRSTKPDQCSDNYEWWWACKRKMAKPPYEEYIGSGERLKAEHIVVDPDDPDYRFALHTRRRDQDCWYDIRDPEKCVRISALRRGFNCCSVLEREELLDLYFVYHDGAQDDDNLDQARKGDLVWRTINGPEPNPDPDPYTDMSLYNCFGNNPGWIGDMAFTPTGPKRLFARIAWEVHSPSFGVGNAVLTCDASSDIHDCTQEANWECLWSLEDHGGTCFDCPIGYDWSKDNIQWRRMAISPELGPNDTNQLFFYTARFHAQLNFLKVFNDGTSWQEEILQDPRTCGDAGPTLVTPTQIIEIPYEDPWSVTSRYVVSAPRDLFESDDGTAWTVWNPDPNTRFFEEGGLLAQASDPDIIYHANHWSIERSEDGGRTFVRVERVIRRFGVPVDDPLSEKGAGCPADDPAPVCTVGDQPAGRLDAMADGLTDLIVDLTDSDRLYAATERGIWMWKYPYPGWPYECITEFGHACAGEAWEQLFPVPDDPSPPVPPPYFYSIAQDPLNPSHLYAGAEGAIYYSYDEGESWEIPLVVPFTAYDIVIIGNGLNNRFFLATDNGVYVSEDGQTYRRTLHDLPVRDIDTGPLSFLGNGMQVAAVSTNYQDHDPKNGLYLSYDDGENWSKVVADDYNQNFVSVQWSSVGEILAGKVGDGLFVFDPAPDLDCDHFKRFVSDGSPGRYGYGWDMTELPNTKPGEEGPTCSSFWAAMEFEDMGVSTEVRIRVMDADGLEVNTLNPQEPNTIIGGALAGVGDLDGDDCPNVAIGLLHSNPLEDRVRFLDACNPTPIVDPLTDLHEMVPSFGSSLDSDGRYLAVGAPLARQVYVYDLTALSNPPAVITNPALEFGAEVAFGELDGGGNIELAVGAPGANGGAGEVFIYQRFGPIWMPVRQLNAELGSPVFGRFGSSLSSGHDGRGLGGPDTVDDLIVGAPEYAGGQGLAVIFSNLWDDTPLMIIGDSPGERFGSAVLVTGDLTEDGVPDYVIGAPSRAGIGAADVYESTGTDAVQWCTLFGQVGGGAFGAVVERAGDVDQNGSIDLLISGPQSGPGIVYFERVGR
ncbi:hypothetical protein ACFLU6_06390 [Acidobacteriota bacterium]